MAPVALLLQLGGPSLQPDADLLQNLTEKLNPPAPADFGPTLASLIELQQALGVGWLAWGTIPACAGETDTAR